MKSSESLIYVGIQSAHYRAKWLFRLHPWNTFPQRYSPNNTLITPTLKGEWELGIKLWLLCGFEYFKTFLGCFMSCNRICISLSFFLLSFAFFFCLSTQVFLAPQKEKEKKRERTGLTSSTKMDPQPKQWEDCLTRLVYSTEELYYGQTSTQTGQMWPNPTELR